MTSQTFDILILGKKLAGRFTNQFSNESCNQITLLFFEYLDTSVT